MGIKALKTITVALVDFVIPNNITRHSKWLEYSTKGFALGSCELQGEPLGSRFMVDKIILRGEGSYEMAGLLPKIAPESRGRLELIIVWDDLESIDHIKITNGKYFEENLDLEEILRAHILQERPART